MFSKTCEYGIKSILYIAVESLSGKRVKLNQITENIDSPEAFTAKILGTLNRNNLIDSYTGPYGGFEINRIKMKTIKISQIVKAIDGDLLYDNCPLGLSECNNINPCPLHDKFIPVRNELKNMLENTTVYDLAIGLKSGKSILLNKILGPNF